MGNSGRALDIVGTRVGVKQSFLVFNTIHSIVRHFERERERERERMISLTWGRVLISRVYKPDKERLLF